MIKRQEMERNLPEASGNLCAFLWGKMADAGIPISQEDLVLIGRIVSDYFRNTTEGKETALKLLTATVKPADPKNAYFPRGTRGEIGKAIPAEDLHEFRGWIYKKSRSAAYEEIEIDKGGNLGACETTGILGPLRYCVQTVKVRGSGGKEHLADMSNYARLHSDQPDVRETAKYDTCLKCPVEGCDYHPSRAQRMRTTAVREERQLMLVPQTGGF